MRTDRLCAVAQGLVVDIALPADCLDRDGM